MLHVPVPQRDAQLLQVALVKCYEGPSVHVLLAAKLVRHHSISMCKHNADTGVLDLNSHHQSIRDSFQWDHQWT